MSKYYDEWVAANKPSYRSFAKKKNLSESTIRTSINRHLKKLEKAEEAEDGIKHGMSVLGLTGPPKSGWVKSNTPDQHDRTYSFYVKEEIEEQNQQEKIEAIAAIFTGTSPVKFEVLDNLKTVNRERKAFISINDLHANSLAWGEETGYGDWNLEIALDRLTQWLNKLLNHVYHEGVDEIILYYNGDINHTNGKVPMTSTPGTNHVLDTSGSFFKGVNLTTERIIMMTDIASQIANVRLVIKRGNHDGDSYLALLQGAKWRYHNQENVTVELDANDYWKHIFGQVALFGHHGDKIKPEHMVMMLQERYRKDIADVKHLHIWTGDKHHLQAKQFPGVRWEQASSWCEPDQYGSAWGNQAMAQAVIYDELEGEVARFTVNASQIFSE